MSKKEDIERYKKRIREITSGDDIIVLAPQKVRQDYS